MSETNPGQAMVTLTDHAMLVVWGEYARKIGLIQALQRVDIPQKTYDHTPQTKLIEFLVNTLAGCAHLKDLDEGHHPITHDQAVAEAWGVPGWAHYSSVSRTLAACIPKIATEVTEVLAQVTQPFLARELTLLRAHQDELWWDLDLTPRRVSNTSKSYPEATFGWMGDEVGLGYQAAVVSLRSLTYRRFLLAAQRHTGATVSGECLRELVQVAESRTCLRPLRRPDLVKQRLVALQERLPREQAELQASQLRVAERQICLEQVHQQQVLLEQALGHLAATPGSRQKPEGPYSRQTKAQCRLTVYQERQGRRQKDLARAQRVLAQQEQEITSIQQEIGQLQAYHDKLVTENQANQAPIRVILRIDAGFASGANLTWLIEQGYEIYTKSLNDEVTASLRRRVTEAMTWQRVGDNAEMIAWAGQPVSQCAYPLDVGLERFQTGEATRYSTLLHYGPQSVTMDLTKWFHDYNGRQLVEAGNKESKGVWNMRHPKVRSAGGLIIQEQFGLFGANFVRWAAHWVAENSLEVSPPFDTPQVSVKQMVQVAANTTAEVTRQPGTPAVVVEFAPSSPFRNCRLVLGGWVFQPSLPLFANGGQDEQNAFFSSA
jgi:hypothetical protein